MMAQSTLAAPTWRREYRETASLAGPLALTQLAQFSMSLTDTLMIGRLGKEALAAGGLATALYIIAFLFSLGIVVAVSPIAAQAHGARKPRLVRRAVRQGLWVATLLGIAFAIALWQAKAILVLFGQDPVAALRSQEYVRAAVWGLVPALWIVVLRAFVAIMGRPSILLPVMIAGFFLNLVGDYVLMFGHWGFPRLELMGVGIATTVANVFKFTVLLLFAARARGLRRYAILGRLWRPDWPLFREIFQVGMPISGMIMMEHLLFATAVFMLGILGTSALAAHMIAINCAATSFMVPLGIGQAATIRVGIAVGRGDEPGARRAGWSALGLGAGFMIGPAVLFAAVPAGLIALFIDIGDAANERVVALATSYLLIAAAFQLFDGCQAIAVGSLRGLKDTRVPMLIGFVGYIVIGVSASYALGFHTALGGVGVWLGLLVALVLVAVLLTLRFHRTTAARAGLAAA